MVSARDDAGSALIWFVFLVAFLTLVILSLAAAIHQYMFARELKDLTEQFAIALKSQVLAQPKVNPNLLAAELLSQVGPKYSFAGLSMPEMSLQSGNTVKVIFCGTWSSPIVSIDAARTICEVAFAR